MILLPHSDHYSLNFGNMKKQQKPSDQPKELKDPGNDHVVLSLMFRAPRHQNYPETHAWTGCGGEVSAGRWQIQYMRFVDVDINL